MDFIFEHGLKIVKFDWVFVRLWICAPTSILKPCVQARYIYTDEPIILQR